MTPVEIIAAIFAIAVIIKAILFNLIKPEKFLKLGEKTISNKIMPGLFFIVLVVLGYYLLQEMSIVQIFAASLFGIFLYALALILYPKELMVFMKKVLKDKKKLIIPWIIWIILAIWVLKALFGYCAA